MIKPVDRYLQILHTIERENQTGIGVNKIIRKTGSTDKQRIINCMRDLEGEKIIETKSSSAHHQTKIKRLTNLGWELVRLSHNLERFTDACSQLRQVMKEQLSIPPGVNKNIRKSILRNKGWTSEEISNYDKICQRIHLAEDIGSPSEVVNMILTKYILTLHKFRLGQNSIGKLILDKIVMDTVYAQFSVAASDLVPSNSWLPRKELEFERTVLHNVFDSSHIILSDKNVIGTPLMKLCLMDNPFDNRFISTKIRQILESTYALLNVPNEIIDIQTRGFYDMAKRFENHDHLLYKQIAGAFNELAIISEKAKNKSS